MRARLSAREHRRSVRLHGDQFDLRLFAAEIAAHTCQCTARTDAGDKVIDLTVGILPDFGTRGLLMRRRIRGIHELSGNKAVRNLLCELFRFGHCALHALGALCQNELRAVGLHEISALHAHRVRHHNDNAIASRRRDRGEADAGIAGSRLNDDRALLQDTALLRVVEHAAGNSVLHGACRVKVLELCENARL